MKKFAFVAAAVAFAAVQPAIAQHGKVGTWHLETDSAISDPHHVLSTMPSIQAIYFKDAYKKKTKTDYCMQAADVAADVVSVPGCTVGPTAVQGQIMQADYTCEGKLAGAGRMQVTYDSPEHFTGISIFQLKTNSLGLQSKTTYEGKWTGDTCTVPPAN